MADEPIPWHSDVVQRPVKFVRAKGGVFICGGQKNELSKAEWVIHRNEQTEKARWQQVFSKQELGHLVDWIFPYCGAYGAVGANPNTDPPIKGTPTFVMAGQCHSYDGNPTALENEKQIIMTSKDGKNWSETRREQSGFCYAAGWSKKDNKFYVQCVEFIDLNAEAFNVVVLASENGKDWQQAASVSQDGFGNYAHKLLMDTGNKSVKDIVDQIVPNGGYYGITESGNLIIKPERLAPYNPSTPAGAANDKIEIIERRVDPESGAVTIIKTTKKIDGMTRITCVAYAGGIWQAAGYGDTGETEDTNPDNSKAKLKIATSVDDGDTWTIEYTTPEPSFAWCLMGAPSEMF